ncbi:MAG: AMP-binding protein [Candidatus Dormibacteria bacterium]
MPAFQTLSQLLDVGAAADRAVVVPGGPVLSYDRLRELVGEASARLASLGAERGRRVALALPNGPEALVLFLAAASTATACPLNPAYKRDEFSFYLEDTGAQLLLLPPGEGKEARRALRQGGRVVEVAIDAQGHLEMARGPGPAPTSEPPQPDDVALVLHTSGTTSRPKRVPLRQRNLVASIGNIGRHYQLSSDDVSLCLMPLFHVHGLLASALATLAEGGTVVVPRGFQPMQVRRLLEEHRPTWFSASPTPHRLILMRLGKAARGRERLRFVRSCSSALARAQLEAMEEAFGVPVLEAYGMTEASHQMASNPLPPGRRQPGTVGRGTGVDIATMDNAGHLLTTGEAGEVVIRGPNVIDGYEGNPDANRASFTEGWFRTGDLGRLDADGVLTLAGRLKEMINRGGEKIAPAEVDQVLESHPAVAEAVAFGIAHPVWGEEVAAAVVLSREVEKQQLAAHCRERLADFKVPTTFFFVEAIPKTPTGKVQRRLVREAVAPG